MYTDVAPARLYCYTPLPILDPHSEEKYRQLIDRGSIEREKTEKRVPISERTDEHRERLVYVWGVRQSDARDSNPNIRKTTILHKNGKREPFSFDPLT
jgi:hypothetical protein